MIKKISSGIALTIRVLKNALLRPFRVIYSKINYMFSAGRVATAIPGAVKKLPKIAKRKPEKREDYFDWGSIYVAKSLVLLVAVLLVAIPLVYVFLLHPLFTSWWWVRDFRGNDAALSSYSGRVRIYYGEELDELRFEGRLKDGKYEEFGEEYWENGRNKYSGNYSEGQYSGSGILYLEDGTVLYRGEFADGKYNGSGELTENGRTFSGEFRNGVLQGSGTISQDGVVLFTGNFTDGIPEGAGKENYADGSLHYSGGFSGGVPHGEALEYYPDGTLKYNGRFTAGKYSGEGTLYDERGVKIYSGGFEMGEYSGTGTLYENGVRVLEEGTTAQPGQYEILGAEVPAGKTYGAIRIEVAKSAELDTQQRELTLCLTDSPDLRVGPDLYLKANVSWHNMLPRPATTKQWSTYNAFIESEASSGSSSTEAYSQAGHQLLLDIFGWEVFPDWGPDYSHYIDAWRARAQAWYDEWKAANPGQKRIHESGSMKGREVTIRTK